MPPRVNVADLLKRLEDEEENDLDRRGVLPAALKKKKKKVIIDDDEDDDNKKTEEKKKSPPKKKPSPPKKKKTKKSPETFNFLRHDRKKKQVIDLTNRELMQKDVDSSIPAGLQHYDTEEGDSDVPVACEKASQEHKDGVITVERLEEILKIIPPTSKYWKRVIWADTDSIKSYVRGVIPKPTLDVLKELETKQETFEGIIQSGLWTPDTWVYIEDEQDDEEDEKGKKKKKEAKEEMEKKRLAQYKDHFDDAEAELTQSIDNFTQLEITLGTYRHATKNGITTSAQVAAEKMDPKVQENQSSYEVLENVDSKAVNKARVKAAAKHQAKKAKKKTKASSDEYDASDSFLAPDDDTIDKGVLSTDPFEIINNPDNYYLVEQIRKFALSAVTQMVLFTGTLDILQVSQLLHCKKFGYVRKFLDYIDAWLLDYQAGIAVASKGGKKTAEKITEKYEEEQGHLLDLNETVNGKDKKTHEKALDRKESEVARVATEIQLSWRKLIEAAKTPGVSVAALDKLFKDRAYWVSKALGPQRDRALQEKDEKGNVLPAAYREELGDLPLHLVLDNTKLTAADEAGISEEARVWLTDVAPRSFWVKANIQRYWPGGLQVVMKEVKENVAKIRASKSSKAVKDEQMKTAIEPMIKYLLTTQKVFYDFMNHDIERATFDIPMFVTQLTENFLQSDEVAEFLLDKETAHLIVKVMEVVKRDKVELRKQYPKLIYDKLIAEQKKLMAELEAETKLHAKLEKEEKEGVKSKKQAKTNVAKELAKLGEKIAKSEADIKAYEAEKEAFYKRENKALTAAEKQVVTLRAGGSVNINSIPTVTPRFGGGCGQQQGGSIHDLWAPLRRYERGQSVISMFNRRYVARRSTISEDPEYSRDAWAPMF